jgi:hypothetical protein
MSTSTTAPPPETGIVGLPMGRIREVSEYTPEQQEKLLSLAASAAEFLLADDPASLREWTLWHATHARYLRARSWDLAKATQMLKATVEWRREYLHPVLHTKEGLEEVMEQAQKGKLIRRGVDRDGHPVLIMRPRLEHSKDKDKRLRHFAFHMEDAVEAAKERNLEKMVWIIDQRDAPGGISDAGLGKATLDILQNHFPERLRVALIIEPSWAFWAFFKIISPFIDPVTKAKIVFVSGKDEQRREILTKYIEPELLLKEFHGEDPYEFNHQEYFARFVEKQAKE